MFKYSLHTSINRALYILQITFWFYLYFQENVLQITSRKRIHPIWMPKSFRARGVVNLIVRIALTCVNIFFFAWTISVIEYDLLCLTSINGNFTPFGKVFLLSFHFHVWLQIFWFNFEILVGGSFFLLCLWFFSFFVVEIPVFYRFREIVGI